MKSKKLPSFCLPSRKLNDIGGVIIHYFSAKNVDPDRWADMLICRRLFIDLNREKIDREWYMKGSAWPDERMYASAHVLIGRDGASWQLADFTDQAYHAGYSMLNGRQSCNQWTLGVELVGTSDSGFTDEQYAELARFLIRVFSDYGLDMNDVAGHDEVRNNVIKAGVVAPAKFDPSGLADGTGDNFNWNKLKLLVRHYKKPALIRAGDFIDQDSRMI